MIEEIYISDNIVMENPNYRVMENPKIRSEDVFFG